MTQFRTRFRQQNRATPWGFLSACLGRVSWFKFFDHPSIFLLRIRCRRRLHRRSSAASLSSNRDCPGLFCRTNRSTNSVLSMMIDTRTVIFDRIWIECGSFLFLTTRPHVTQDIMSELDSAIVSANLEPHVCSSKVTSLGGRIRYSCIRMLLARGVASSPLYEFSFNLSDSM